MGNSLPQHSPKWGNPRVKIPPTLSLLGQTLHKLTVLCTVGEEHAHGAGLARGWVTTGHLGRNVLAWDSLAQVVGGAGHGALSLWWRVKSLKRGHPRATAP